MKDFFYPESVAVIGVSTKRSNLGRNIVGNLIEFEYTGAVYAVGPSGGIVGTHRIYSTIADLPDGVDLAVVLTPARIVPDVMQACGKKGIRRVIVETAGFREYGEQGRLLEERMVSAAERYGIRFIGPNCVGAINMENGLCLPFPQMRRGFKPGDVSIISQSGGVGMSALNLMNNEGVGLNKFISVGNMLNVNAEDLLDYMIADKGTRIIFVYLETIGDGRRLMEIARRSTKPILIFKANIGTLSQTIAASHTASLSSDDRVVEAAFKQAGIIRVHDATGLGNNLKVLELPPMQGKNVAIISRSGGHAVIAADACELAGFSLAPLPEHFLREIEKHFRASVIKLANPLDLGDLFDLELYAKIAEDTIQLEEVDGVIFFHTALPSEYADSCMLVERLVQSVEKHNKPIAFYISAGAGHINTLRQHSSFPIFTQVVETIRALEMSYKHWRNLSRTDRPPSIPSLKVDHAAVRTILEKAQSQERDLLISEAMMLFEHYGIPTAQGRVAKTVEQAQAAADKIGYPVAIKVIAEQISHKSDVGGVQLNLCNGPAVAAAFHDMMERIEEAYPQAKLDGVLVQPMVNGGRELILGGRQDPQFGPVVLVGLGGIFVEILKEVAVRITPFSSTEAMGMITGLRGAAILQGARGTRRSDLESVVDAIMRLSQLLNDYPEIKEVDINPLQVFYEQDGCQALDARVIL